MFFVLAVRRDSLFYPQRIRKESAENYFSSIGLMRIFASRSIVVEKQNSLIMSETKTFVFPEAGTGGGGSGMLGMLAPLLQKNGLDPNLLLAMNNRGNNGFGGDGSWFMWIIFLFFLFPLFGRNGWGNNGDGNNGGGYGAAGIPNLINNDAGRELLMSAIQGNGQAINTLATSLNCSVGQIQQSINSVMTQIQGVGNQIGMSSQQIINAVQSGNCQIAQAIADCCCKTQNAITTMGYENQLAICNQTHTLVDNANQNALALRDGQQSGTTAIIAKLDQMNVQHLQDKLDAERDAKFALKSQLDNEHQSQLIMQSQAQMIAPVNAALGDLSTRLAAIECRQPPTFPMPYYPVSGSYIPVNYGVNVNPYAAASAGSCGC